MSKKATKEEVHLEGHPVIKNCTKTHMKALTDYSKPARMAPGLTRSTLPLMTQGGSDESDMRRGSGCQGGCVPLRTGSVNVGSWRGKDGEVVNMAVEGRLDFCCLQETR